MSQEQFDSQMASLRAALLRKCVPAGDVTRLLEELSAHLQDCQTDLIREGMPWADAQKETTRQLGSEKQIVDAAVRELRRGSFIGRHRILCFILLPFFIYPWVYLTLTVPLAGLIMFGALGGRDTTHTTSAFICKWILEGFANVAVPVAVFWLIARLGGKTFAGRGYIAVAQVLVFLTSVFAEMRVHIPTASQNWMSITLGVPFTLRGWWQIESIWACVYVTILISVLAARRRPAIPLLTP